ncbi:MAG: membrane protein insertion efficiency factor YidD [Candidatus Kryptoniota bacterium]
MKKISNNFLKSAATLSAETAIALINLYKKLVSPLFPPSCRFYPSCSSYAVEAFHVHGFFKGMVLSAWRVLRCNPFNKGGYDPVK